MISAIACVLLVGVAGPKRIQVISGTVWSVPEANGQRRLIRLYGIQESSQPDIRRRAKIASEKYVRETEDIGLDFDPIPGIDGDPQPVVVGFTTFTGDLAFREQNTYLYGPGLLGEGLSKINPQELKGLGKWAINQFACAQERAKVYKAGMWAAPQERRVPVSRSGDLLGESFPADFVGISSWNRVKLTRTDEAGKTRSVAVRLYGLQPLKRKSDLQRIEKYLRQPQGPESVRDFSLYFVVAAIDKDGTPAVVVTGYVNSGVNAREPGEVEEFHATADIVALGLAKLDWKEVPNLSYKVQAKLTEAQARAQREHRGLWSKK